MDGTRVRMADGQSKPIEEMRVGDEVLTHYLTKHCHEAHRVRGVMEFEVNCLVTMRLEDGAEIVCTPSHLFYAIP